MPARVKPNVPSRSISREAVSSMPKAKVASTKPAAAFEPASSANATVATSVAPKIAPTATISNIIGVSACIEPTFQNLYVKSNLSGEFTVVNDYLVRDLKRLG